MNDESHPQPHDDDETEDNDCDASLEDDGRIVSNAQSRAYLEKNNSKKQLFLMCFRLTEDDDGGTPAVLDVDAEPWNGIKKRDIKPTRIEYAEEITRCISLVFTEESDRAHQHKPANWSLAK